MYWIQYIRRKDAVSAYSDAKGSANITVCLQYPGSGRLFLLIAYCAHCQLTGVPPSSCWFGIKGNVGLPLR